MPRFAANLSLLFAEHPLQDRFTAARRAGFERVELLFPYEMDVCDLKTALDANRLELALINTPAGDWNAGERGFAAVPGKESVFRDGFERALTYATSLQVPHIHIMSGVSDAPGAEDVLFKNLSWASARAPDQSLTIEPINPFDMPGYVLNDFDQAARLLDQVNAPNLHLQFDAYHAHRITGDVLGAWEKHGARAKHVQIAGFPGRHEPIGDEIDYVAFFSQLENSDYMGVVSAEYFPKAGTEDGLGWMTS